MTLSDITKNSSIFTDESFSDADLLSLEQFLELMLNVEHYYHSIQIYHQFMMHYQIYGN